MNAVNYELKPEAYAMKYLLLLMLGMLAFSVSCKTRSPTTAEIVRLYSLPPVLKIHAGTEIVTADGVVVVPVETLLHSHGSYMEQVERALRP